MWARESMLNGISLCPWFLKAYLSSLSRHTSKSKQDTDVNERGLRRMFMNTVLKDYERGSFIIYLFKNINSAFPELQHIITIHKNHNDNLKAC